MKQGSTIELYFQLCKLMGECHVADVSVFGVWVCMHVYVGVVYVGVYVCACARVQARASGGLQVDEG